MQRYYMDRNGRLKVPHQNIINFPEKFLTFQKQNLYYIMASLRLLKYTYWSVKKMLSRH